MGAQIMLKFKIVLLLFVPALFFSNELLSAPVPSLKITLSNQSSAPQRFNVTTMCTVSNGNNRLSASLNNDAQSEKKTKIILKAGENLEATYQWPVGMDCYQGSLNPQTTISWADQGNFYVDLYFAPNPKMIPDVEVSTPQKQDTYTLIATQKKDTYDVIAVVSNTPK